MAEYIILFFENYLDEEPHRSFRKNLLLSSIGDRLHIIDAQTFKSFENIINEPSFSYSHKKKVIILDLMIKVPHRGQSIRWLSNGNIVNDTLVGAALLERCRAGYYGENLVDVPIYIRTVNTSPRVRALCLSLGATGYYRSGDQDEILRTSILELLA